MRGEMVNAIGALTTLVALAVAYALAQRGHDVMKVYMKHVIPLGAIGLGLAAASGYVITAWYTGLKMRRRLIIGIIAQLAVAYFVAQYELFRRVVPFESSVSFWEWFDATTRSLHYAPQPGEAIERLEEQGYLIRALELIGFTFGGWLWPAALAKKPYCEPCRRYQRTSSMAWLAAGHKRPVATRADREIDARIREDAKEALSQLFSHARAGATQSFLALRDRVDQTMSTIMSLEASLRLDMHHCPGCFSGKLVATLITKQGTQNPVKTPAGVLALDVDTARVLARWPSRIGYLPVVPDRPSGSS